MDNYKVDVKKIMEEIKEQAKARQDEDILGFDEMMMENDITSLQYQEPFNKEEFIREMTEVNRYFWVNPEMDILKGNKVKIFIKRAVRKLSRFYVRPLVDSQNEFNSSVVRALNQTRNYIATHDNIERKIDDLQLAINKEILKPMNLWNNNYLNMKQVSDKLLTDYEKSKKLEGKVGELEAEIKVLKQEINSLRNNGGN